jgi:hypothetical protein
MSGDLQAYQVLRATTSSERSDLEDAPYVSNEDSVEARRLQELAGVTGYGDTSLLDEHSELQNTLGELGIYANGEQV